MNRAFTRSLTYFLLLSLERDTSLTESPMIKARTVRVPVVRP